MGKYKNIVVTGSLSWDIIMDFPKKFADYLQPDMLHQINVSFVVNKLEKQLGGTATNIAYAISQATKVLYGPQSREQSIYILGAVGKDGKDHLSFLKKNGIETKGILVDGQNYNACGTVITDIKDNQIWGFYYGACEKGENAPYATYAKSGTFMIISANHPSAFLAAQNHAVSKKVDYMYDVGMAMSWIKENDLRRGVDHATYIIGNDYEIALITKTLKTSVAKLVGKGKIVITTLGEKGVLAQDRANSFHIPAYRVKKVLDPTGAGDAWRGGFIASFNGGRGLKESLKAGNVTASFAIESYGTVNYRITKKDFNTRLKVL